MSITLYMDVHVHGQVTRGLIHRGVDVLTAQDDGADTLPDPALLDRATALGRVLFSQDPDLLAETRRRQQAGEHFAGLVYLVYVGQLKMSLGHMIRDLEMLAKVYEPA